MKYLMLIKHAESNPAPSVPKALGDAMGVFVPKGSRAASSRTRLDSKAPLRDFACARVAASYT